VAAALSSACATDAFKPAADFFKPVAKVFKPATNVFKPATDVYKSDGFMLVVASPNDSSESLAARYLGDAAKAWMIEDYNGTRTFQRGQHVVVPLKPWNLAGVYPEGYQLVPILVYHNVAPQAKGRLVIAAATFEQQMRYLKREGYRVVRLADFVAWTRLERQLPKKAVVLTFDDGYRAFLDYAYPVLKELGFPATLFVYTDYVGAGRNALSWEDLKALAAEGFDIEAHSKTHGDLQRAAHESEPHYAQRMQAELGEPLRLFMRNLGRPTPLLAFPYGRADEALLVKVREQGYLAAFTVRREGSPAFVSPLLIPRSQIYSDMTLEDFAKNLNVFHEEALK